jgi:hypothetical protein
MADGPAGQATFDEPGGLSIADDTLYVADTNNHLVRTADLATGRVGTFAIRGLAAPGAPTAAGDAEPAEFSGETVTLPARTVPPGQVKVSVRVSLPDGYKLNADAPNAVLLRSGAADVLSFDGELRTLVVSNNQPWAAAAAAAEGRTELAADLSLYYCPVEKQALCYFREVRLVVPLTVAAGADANELTLSWTLPPPKD